MFSLHWLVRLSVCLSVCLLTKLLRNLWMNAMQFFSTVVLGSRKIGVDIGADLHFDLDRRKLFLLHPITVCENVLGVSTIMAVILVMSLI